jgi:hypothetical protein
MYIVGGDAVQGYHINDIWSSKDGISWKLINSNPPWAPRALHLTFSYGDYMFVVSGQTMPALVTFNIVDEIYYRDVWRSADGFEWEKVNIKSDIFTPRGGYNGSGFVLNGDVYIMGGFTYEGLSIKRRRISNDIWRSTGSLEKWEKIGNFPQFNGGRGQEFMYYDTAVYDGALWVIGGFSYDSGNTGRIMYTKNLKDWMIVDCSPIVPTHATSVWSTESGIVFTLGNGWDKTVWKIEK